MLMKPMDTAADDAVRVRVGNAQNGDGQKVAAKPVRHSHAITSHDAPETPGRRGQISEMATTRSCDVVASDEDLDDQANQ